MTCLTLKIVNEQTFSVDVFTAAKRTYFEEKEGMT